MCKGTVRILIKKKKKIARILQWSFSSAPSKNVPPFELKINLQVKGGSCYIFNTEAGTVHFLCLKITCELKICTHQVDDA